MIPDKINKVYFTITEVAKELGTSAWILERILDAMKSKHLIKVSRSRIGRIRLTANHIEKLKPKVKNYRSII